MIRTLLALCATLVLMAPLARAADKPVVAFVQDTLANDFRKNQVMETGKALGNHPEVEFKYSDANGSTALLISQIDQFVKEQVDVLIVGTNDAKAVVPAIDNAMAAGVHVIILDRGIDGTNYTTFINSDNIEIGQLGGQYIVERLNGQGKVLLLEGIQTADVTHLRTEGFMNAVAQHPGIEVIRRTGNYLRKDALIEMDKLLASGERVDAIFSESDSMLSGVRMVLPNYQINAQDLIMVGCDFTTEAKNAILDGSQTGSVKFPLGGKESAEVALQLIAGETVPKHIVIPVELVTPENVAEAEPVF